MVKTTIEVLSAYTEGSFEGPVMDYVVCCKLGEDTFALKVSSHAHRLVTKALAENKEKPDEEPSYGSVLCKVLEQLPLPTGAYPLRDAPKLVREHIQDLEVKNRQLAAELKEARERVAALEKRFSSACIVGIDWAQGTGEVRK